MWNSLSVAALSAFAIRASVASPVWPDYVIIGGSPAGFILAEELSKNSNKSVVLLEAGPDIANVEAIDVPGFAPSLLFSQYTWNFTTQPDPNLNGNTPELAQGHGFRGGSAVNYMGACLGGAPSVFDEWASISGDSGLRWENFQKSFKAVFHLIEADIGYDTHLNTSAYGNGPIDITAPDDTLGFVLNLVESWKSVLKLPQVDLNDGSGLGVSTGTSNIRASNRTRSYAPQGFS